MYASRDPQRQRCMEFQCANATPFRLQRSPQRGMKRRLVRARTFEELRALTRAARAKLERVDQQTLGLDTDLIFQLAQRSTCGCRDEDGDPILGPKHHLLALDKRLDLELLLAMHEAGDGDTQRVGALHERVACRV